MRTVKTPGGKRTRRLGLLAAVAIGAVAIVGALSLALRPSPLPSETANPTASPGATPAAVADDGLPRPSTSFVVLLVADPAALDAREVQWIGDLRRAYGRAEILGYSSASAEALAPFRTIFVIGASPAVDVGALATAYASGASVHLIGAAASYRDAVAGGAP